MTRTESGSERQNRNNELFRAVFGIHNLPFEYTSNGVVVRSGRPEESKVIRTANEVIAEQYASSLEPPTSDLDLFVAMTLHHLRIAIEDAPPEIPGDPLPRERYRVEVDGGRLLVFCLEFDGLPDAATIEGAKSRLIAHVGELGPPWGALCVIHHQRHLPAKSRTVQDAIPTALCRLAAECGMTIVTAVDLRLLVRGAAQYGWDVGPLRQLLCTPGRQADVPPTYKKVGRVFHVYPRNEVVSVELDEGATLRIGDTICIRLATRYDEQPITSLQVNRDAKDRVTGAVRVGVATTLTKKDLAAGQLVFVKE